MSLTRQFHRQTLTLKASKDYIWISEDVLNSAMQRFAHGRVPKRHVGLAPGPLEARKRAARRRMMNLAQVDGGVVFDPNVLPGLAAPGSAQWTWQSPRPLTPEKKAGKPKMLIPMACWSANYGQKSGPCQLG